ncbi:MAG: gas vesicle protein [Leptolyngbyaceae bacterium]|nr:gas vesicle protein [Leptolyngbyaceae bacterium]
MTSLPQPRSAANANRTIATSTSGSTLADILERVLDKGIVIAGDISVSVGSTELLSIRIRLLISSVDKAKEIGINWWESDPYLSKQAQQPALSPSQTQEMVKMQERIESLESELRALREAKEP